MTKDQIIGHLNILYRAMERAPLTGPDRDMARANCQELLAYFEARELEKSKPKQKGKS